MGLDQAKAFAAAKKLNALLATSSDLVSKVLYTGQTIAEAVRLFRRDDVPTMKWAPSTANEYRIVLDRIVRIAGDRDVAEFRVKDAAALLDEHAPGVRARQTLRLVLGWVFNRAIAEGWTDANPILITRKGTFVRQRERLTLEAYNAIHEKAPQWLRNAMDLSLAALLRQDDVVSARFTDWRDGALWVVPAKTKSRTGLRLSIVDANLRMPLAAIVARCRDDVASPFLIHRLPEKARPAKLRAASRTHHTQVLGEQVSRAFADAREGAKITSEHPPTFHEIRSLGGALLRDAGWSEEQVQCLMGHASRTMTQVYLQGHEQPWTEVRGGAIG